MMCVDGNGNSEIILLFLTWYKTEDAITHMVKTFKKHNPQWLSTKVMISDKNFNEGAIFKKEFPDAALHLCLFHTLRSFKSEITTENMGIRSEEQDKLVYSQSESAYMENY